MPKKKAARKKVKAKKTVARKARPRVGPKVHRKKTVVKRAAVTPPAPVLPWRVPLAGEKRLGVIDDFYGHINVVAFTLEHPLSVGDRIHVRGHTTDLTQTVQSIQINHQNVSSAQAGDAVGIQANDKCRKGDYVYLISD